jgi:dCMP deaminase
MVNGLLRKILKKISPDYIPKRYIQSHMEAAYVYSKLSYCLRLKVGAVIVKDNRIISVGYNGSPAGWNNCCEDANNKTLPHILHAEKNCILKLAKSTESGENSVMYVTHEPCQDCATLIYGAGIKTVYWSEPYISASSGSGVDFLKKCKIKTKRIVL